MYKLIKFPTISDNRGNLTFVNQQEHVPFEIKRVFTLSNISYASTRGNHAHKNLIEVVIPIQGSVSVILCNSNKTTKIRLDKSDTGLVLYPEIWRTLVDFSKDCICLVLCSELHNEDDYLRDWDKYIKFYNE